MKKLISVFALSVLIGIGQGVAVADVQIDEGQPKDQKAVKFFVARNGRVGTISKDRVVVWDSTSKDGITVTTTTTSGDQLIAGITLDQIPGVSSDSASDDMSSNNWGRVQTWGLHENVLTQIGTQYTAGSPVMTSSTAGAAGDGYNDTRTQRISLDHTHVGIALETSDTTGGAVTGTVDMMVTAD